ncbi:hypothetical protein HWC53_gp080 [Bacillus phage vB_BmeM-Goe8]|uniref:Uncharacterized protein n=1 Tax=Bacillus phage vB_BmeM-Goe8 TaxID=2593638 RepID=A0A516KN31_9CAUD|nr:hypothetical protein HWC53_gp080 [Bacillus phage vB_BmeM-Goe8]QDP43009.1 hypothetical protein Goe8_c02360 [Bacillus phage vB_BmeM-Goe8]
MARNLNSAHTEIESVEYIVGNTTRRLEIGKPTIRGTINRIDVDTLDDVNGYRIKVFTDKDKYTPYKTIFTNFVEIVHSIGKEEK